MNRADFFRRLAGTVTAAIAAAKLPADDGGVLIPADDGGVLIPAENVHISGNELPDFGRHAVMTAGAPTSMYVLDTTTGQLYTVAVRTVDDIKDVEWVAVLPPIQRFPGGHV